MDHDLIKLVNDFEFILFHQEYHLDDYVSKMKNKIDIHREELIHEIHKKSAKMIKQIDDFYEECKENLSNLNEITKTNRDILNEIKQQNDLDYESCQNMQNLLNEYKNMLKMNKDLQFHPIQSETFGEFFIKELDESSASKVGVELQKSFSDNFSSQSTVMEVIESGHKISIGNFNGEISIFNYYSGKCEHVFKAHNDRISAIKSISKNLLATGSFDKTIKIWNLSVELDSYIQIFQEHKDRITSLSLSNSTNPYLISSSDDRTIKIWNLNSNKCIKTFDEHSESVVHVKINSQNKLVSCSLDRAIKIWNLSTFECEKTIKELDHSIWRLELTKSDKILTVSLDNIKLWDPQNGKCLLNFEAFDSKGFIGKVKVLPEVDDFVIGYQNFDNGKNGDSHCLTVWKLSEQKSIFELNGFGRIESIELSQSGDLICLNSFCVSTRDESYLNLIKVYKLFFN